MSLLARNGTSSHAAQPSAGARSASPVPGQVLDGKYRIDARIAEGGMGVVLRATHLELDRPVAIKLIRPEHTENEEVIARLLTEARIAAGLRSKHVNHVLDVGRTVHGIPYLVLEYMEGSDLRRYLEQRGRMPITQAVDCVMQTCEALAEAHAFGIVHRDLKPENLFLSEETDGGYVLKVLDFGISKAPPSRRRGRTLTNPFEIVGSPNYMAPEQIRGGQVDARADVWALGALLYELCSGAVPFGAETVTETFSMILDKRYELPLLDAGAGTEHLRMVIDRCLSESPDDRYQSVVELADALSPLGSDMLQGKRVAKVAFATRARVAATQDPSAAINQGTPLALSSNLEPELELSEVMTKPRGHKLAWLLAGAFAISVGALSFQFGSRSAASAQAAASPPRPDVAQTGAASAAPAEAQLEVQIPAPATAVDALPLSHAPAAKLAPAPRPFRRPYARPTPPVAVDVVPYPAPTAPTAVATPAVVASAPKGDAWDPKSFGGRR